MAVFIWFVTFAVSCTLAFGAANWAYSRSRLARNCITFVLSAGAAYSASFVIDMCTRAALGTIPGGSNVIRPSVTWSIIALVLAVATITTKGSRYFAAAPYALVALLALTVSGVHTQNLVVGIAFVPLTIIVALAQVRSSRADDSAQWHQAN